MGKKKKKQDGTRKISLLCKAEPCNTLTLGAVAQPRHGGPGGGALSCGERDGAAGSVELP